MMFKILCIEDEDNLRRDICEELRDTGYEVIEAADGVEGLHLLQTQRPDLVLCDIRMPRMDGHELLSKVRTCNAQWGNVPFIFLTAFGERDDMLKGLRDGADDFLTKPIDFDVLLVRVETCLRQVRRVTSHAQNSHDEIKKEMERAHTMQSDLLPCQKTIKDVEEKGGLEISSHYEPSTELGGDMWGVHLLGPDKVMFYLVDFSGHGISAAMNTFRLHSKIDSDPIGDKSPAAYLTHLNHWMCNQLQTGQFATVLLGVFDRKAGYFDYAAAGARSPIRISFSDYSIEVGNGKGVPLGIAQNAVYEDRRMKLSPLDKLFFYSDALIEHGRKENLSLGQDGLETMLLNLAQSKKNITVEDILAPFVAVAPKPLDDDLTAICINWKS
ncbi:PP2C family protein-serine/threonine phosphatase [Terasakiella pusilla]|uniref:PP2C family protein-serine/threonine phosphatase n=1 Tax=Terasakiella pusilla TaxID=64973 RepID=UPI003AA9BC96